MKSTQPTRAPQPEPPKSVQQPDDKRELGENGPFNPPLEQIQVTRGKRGGISFIVNGKRIEHREETDDGR